MSNKLLFYIVTFCLIKLSLFANEAHTLYLKAYDSMLENKLTLAETQIRESILKDSSIIESYYLLARILLKQKRNNEAHNIFRKARLLIEKQKEDFELKKSVSLTITESQVNDLAKLSLNNVNQARKAYYLGKIALRTGKLQEAAEHLFVATNLDKGNLDYQNLLATIYLDLNDLNEAEDIFLSSLKENPMQKFIYVDLINKYAELAKPKKALTWVRRAIEVFPKDHYFRDQELYFEHQNRLRRKIEGLDPYLESEL